MMDIVLPSLTELNLASNKYTSLAQLGKLSSAFPSLKKLSLRSNPLHSLDCDECFPRLSALDLSWTDL